MSSVPPGNWDACRASCESNTSRIGRPQGMDHRHPAGRRCRAWRSRPHPRSPRSKSSSAGLLVESAWTTRRVARCQSAPVAARRGSQTRATRHPSGPRRQHVRRSAPLAWAGNLYWRCRVLEVPVTRPSTLHGRGTGTPGDRNSRCRNRAQARPEGVRWLSATKPIPTRSQTSPSQAYACNYWCRNPPPVRGGLMSATSPSGLGTCCRRPRDVRHCAR